MQSQTNSAVTTNPNDARDIYAICPTPFNADDTLYLHSMGSLVDFRISAGGRDWLFAVFQTKRTSFPTASDAS